MTNIAQRIVAMDVWHLALPVRARRDHGIGAIQGECEVVVVRLRAEGGAEGWGEASPWSVFTGSPEASFAALHRYFRPLVVGQSLADRGRILADVQRAAAHCTEAKAALETAVLDLEARIAEVPVWSLLGGRYRDHIPLSVSLANREFARDRELAERLRDDGVRIVKLKSGIAGHRFDIERIEALHADFPEFAVRVDYNQGLKIDEAFACVREVAHLDPDFIEQPVASDQWEIMARLRDSIDVPLLADESIFGPEDMVCAAKAGICDGVSIKIMKAGGIVRAQTVARIAVLNGLTAYGGDMFEAGIAHLAGTHMIAATPEITLGCEFYQAQYYLVEDILAEPFPSHGGKVRVPDGPGLGMIPDIGKIEHFARVKGAS